MTNAMYDFNAFVDMSKTAYAPALKLNELAVRVIDGPRVDLLGIYPTVETVLAQLVVAAAIILVAVFGRRSRSGAETSTEVRR